MLCCLRQKYKRHAIYQGSSCFVPLASGTSRSLDAGDGKIVGGSLSIRKDSVKLSSDSDVIVCLSSGARTVDCASSDGGGTGVEATRRTSEYTRGTAGTLSLSGGVAISVFGEWSSPMLSVTNLSAERVEDYAYIAVCIAVPGRCWASGGVTVCVRIKFACLRVLCAGEQSRGNRQRQRGSHDERDTACPRPS
jgi:hypothetical protein